MARPSLSRRTTDFIELIAEPSRSIARAEAWGSLPVTANGKAAGARCPSTGVKVCGGSAMSAAERSKGGSDTRSLFESLV